MRGQTRRGLPVKKKKNKEKKKKKADGWKVLIHSQYKNDIC